MTIVLVVFVKINGTQPQTVEFVIWIVMEMVLLMLIVVLAFVMVDIFLHHLDNVTLVMLPIIFQDVLMMMDL